MSNIDSTSGESPLKSLERFVVDNDDLLALEEKLGRFNIFDSLGIARAEIRHSNFLAWLLDPNESHGQGAIFLRAVLMDLLGLADPACRPLSPIDLDGEELRGLEVKREWNHIDLLIKSEQPPFVIAIENKVDSTEHGDQLTRYRETVANHYPDYPAMYVFLTIDGNDPSEDTWTPYSYADLHRVLKRVLNTYTSSIGDDVQAFIDHYLRLIGSRFMSDPNIDDLCRKIYQKHRQAIDLIFDRVSNPAVQVVESIIETLEKDDEWEVITHHSKVIHFRPKAWIGILPPIGRFRKGAPDSWMRLRISIKKNACVFSPLVMPTSDLSIRQALIERLTQDQSEFGLKASPTASRKARTPLGFRKLCIWPEPGRPDAKRALEAVNRQMPQWKEQYSGITDALKSIISGPKIV